MEKPSTPKKVSQKEKLNKLIKNTNDQMAEILKIMEKPDDEEPKAENTNKIELKNTKYYTQEERDEAIKRQKRESYERRKLKANPEYVFRSAGRQKKYATDEERLEAKKLQTQASYRRNYQKYKLKNLEKKMKALQDDIDNPK